MTKAERLAEMENQVKELQNNIAALQKEVEKEKIKFTIERFRNNEFAVHCETHEESIIFLAYLQGKGSFKWCGKYLPLQDDYWEVYKENTYYHHKTRLYYGNVNINSLSLPIIKFTTDMLK